MTTFTFIEATLDHDRELAMQLLIDLKPVHAARTVLETWGKVTVKERELLIVELLRWWHAQTATNAP